MSETINRLRPSLPPLPSKMARLPIDERGYPVPFFVAWVDGKPDHRLADPRAVKACVEQNRCWLCGGPLGRFKAFVLGPMCAVNRLNSEPPQHLECSLYAAMACPFLTRPQAKRREANMIEETHEPAGVMIKRNPGAVCVWATLSHRPFRQGRGLLFDLGPPHSMQWFVEGRAGTREEVEESIRTGVPTLIAAAQADGPKAVADVLRAVTELQVLLDDEGGPWINRP